MTEEKLAEIFLKAQEIEACAGQFADIRRRFIHLCEAEGNRQAREYLEKIQYK